MNRTRALEALGVTLVSHGCILLPMFETKLPSQLLEKWLLELADTPQDEISLDLIDKLCLKRLEREALAQSLVQTITIFSKAEMKEGGQCQPIQVVMNVYQLLLLYSARHEYRQVQAAVSAKEIMICPEFNRKRVDEKWRVVKENKLFYNCLRPTNRKHFSQICR